MLNVLASVAQWEREAIGERTSAAMQHIRAQGRYTGGRVPLGFRLGADGESLRVDPEEQALVRRARELHQAGASLRQIAARLNAEGFESRSGRPFGPSQVQCMLAARAA